MSDVKALISKLNPTCRRALETAAELCLAQTHFSVEVEHLLLKLVEAADADLPRILRYYEVDAGAVAKQLGAAIEKLKRGNTRTPTLSPHVLQLFEAAWVTSSLQLGHGAVRSGALLLALLEDDALRALLLEAVPVLTGIPRGRLVEDLPELVRGTAEEAPAAPAAAGGGAARGGASRQQQALDAYTLDLTAEAEAGGSIPLSAGSRNPADHRYSDAPPAEQPDPHRRCRRRQDGRSSKASPSASSRARCRRRYQGLPCARSTSACCRPVLACGANSRTG